MANGVAEVIDQRVLRRVHAKLVTTSREAFVGDAPLMEFIRARDPRCEGVTSPVFKMTKERLLAGGVLSLSTEGSKPVYTINRPIAAIERDRIDQALAEAKRGPRPKNVLAKIGDLPAPALALPPTHVQAKTLEPAARAESVPVPGLRSGPVRYTAYMLEAEFVAWRRFVTSMKRTGEIDELMRNDPFVSRLVDAGVMDAEDRRFVVHPDRVSVVRIDSRAPRNIRSERRELIRAVERLKDESFPTRKAVYDALVASGFPVGITLASFETSMGVAISSGGGGLNIIVIHGSRPDWRVTTTLPGFEYFEFVEAQSGRHPARQKAEDSPREPAELPSVEPLALPLRVLSVEEAVARLLEPHALEGLDDNALQHFVDVVVGEAAIREELEIQRETIRLAQQKIEEILRGRLP